MSTPEASVPSEPVNVVTRGWLIRPDRGNRYHNVDWPEDMGPGPAEHEMVLRTESGLNT